MQCTQTDKNNFKGCTLENNRGDLEIIVFKVKHYHRLPAPSLTCWVKREENALACSQYYQ